MRMRALCDFRMKRQTITANYLKTINWYGDTIVDWASGGKQYFLNGEILESHTYFPFAFDAAITSANLTYTFIYQPLGTKELLLKNGELLREINRSHYFANAYEFPCAFIEVNSVTYLIHCPVAYNQLDFENAETGELLTNVSERKPADFFHSRLAVSSDNSTLISRGWVWHPLDVTLIFDVNNCLSEPKVLDELRWQLPDGAEVCTASFIDSERIVIGSSDEIINDEDLSMPAKHIAIWDLDKKTMSKPVPVEEEFGNLFAINENFAWDFYDFPKIISIETGEIIDKDVSINTGKNRSAIANSGTVNPQIIFNRHTKQIAISGDERIEVLTPNLSAK